MTDSKMGTNSKTAGRSALMFVLTLLWACSTLPQERAATSSAPPAGVDAAELDRLFPRSTLQIATPDARLHTFRIWVADTDPRRMRGLMYVKQMDANAGMLFLYPMPQPISMWMKNTYIPLDMLFVSPDGRVVNVAENTTPFSEATVSSAGPALAVIELNAGTAARLKIRAGAQVMHAAFKKP